MVCGICSILLNSNLRWLQGSHLVKKKYYAYLINKVTYVVRLLMFGFSEMTTLPIALQENDVNILKSIDEGPFQMGTFRETLAEGTEGAPYPGLPKDVYSLSILCTFAKGIGDIVKGCSWKFKTEGLWFRMFWVDRIEVKETMHGVEVQLVMGEHRTELGMLIQVKQGRLSATTATDDCDAFYSDVDEAPTVQTMFMANLSFADPVYNEAGPSYDLDILSEVHDNDHYQDAVCEHHEEHEMHDDVQPTYIVDSHADYMSDSNMIPYDQYTVVDNSLTAELATFKEQVELYERRARSHKDDKQKLSKCRTTTSRPIKALTVYLPNTPAMLVPRVLPTKSQGNMMLLIQKNLLIATMIHLNCDACSKEVFYVATNSDLNVSRFTEMHDAHTIVEARCLEPEAKLSNLRDKIQKDNHNELVKRFSNLKAPTFIHNIHNVVRKVKQVWKPKQVRQVWKPTGKVLTSVGHQWRPRAQYSP
ncbi:hypothetical protein Tco_1018187 [Tanacetum coccineum]|uniref:Uncharacterized protein n=1 Tax=Tanacetum coccineum TaxID=301880 RepID=A0ABQ5FTK9_9ASTR